MNPPSTRILVIDDDEDDYILTAEHLKSIEGRRFEVTWASTYDEALVLLSEQRFDICFFDYLLGARTGLDLLRIAHDLRVQTPIILLTGKGNAKVDAQAMQLGVTDYLEKGELDPEKLERTIRYAIERTATLKALRESEEKYRGIFEDSLDAIYLLDADSQFLDVNDAATRLLGYSKTEFLQKKITDLFVNENFKNLFVNILVQEDSIRDFETELLAADGDIRVCVIACTCHREPGGSGNIFFQGILHDITRRKKAEQQLLIAEKLASTGRFMQMLGHEIRNPLTNIDLATGQLALENTNEELNDFIEIIQRNSKRINQILTDLLQSSNPGQLQFEPSNPNQILDEVLEQAADRIALKNITVQKDYGACELPIRSDRSKLKIALLNITLNAVEIMEADRGRLEMSSRYDKDGCRISIRDNGPGIERENLSRIFEPYFSRKTNGMGLGLAGTLSIVQSHGGSIDVRSELGQGTTFTIFLPA